ncbi:MAG: amino acid transporter, partial [Methanobacterium sp.]
TLTASILGNISQLIVLSVFTILFCYLITCISVFPLRKNLGGGIKLPWIIPILGIIIIVYIMSQCSINQIITGIALIALGIPIYVKYAPRTEIKTVKKDIDLCIGYCKACTRYCSRKLPSQEPFLANLLLLIRRLIRKI